MIPPVALLFIILSCVHSSRGYTFEDSVETTKCAVITLDDPVNNIEPRQTAHCGNADSEENVDTFHKMYVQLKECHDIELQKVQSKCNQSQEIIKLQHKVDKIYAKLSTENQETNNLTRKIEELFAKFTTENRITNDLMQKFVQQFAKSSNIIENTTDINKRTRGKYLGCYQDRKEHVALRGYIMSSSSNNVESCIDVCHSGNFVYAGLQAG